MVVAPPIISQEASYFTRLFSSFILFTLKANEIVTASGSPSGTATTIIVTAIMKDFITSFKDSIQRTQCFPLYISIPKFASKATIVNAAAIVPTSPFFYLFFKCKNIRIKIVKNVPIYSAIVSNFNYKGVGGDSSESFSLS